MPAENLILWLVDQFRENGMDRLDAFDAAESVAESWFVDEFNFKPEWVFPQDLEAIEKSIAAEMAAFEEEAC